MLHGGDAGSDYMVRNEEGIISVAGSDYIPDPRGLGCVIFDKMVEHKDYLAQTDGITGDKDTYESLLQRCIRTAITMRSRGVTSEDIITICSYNHLNCCVPYIAGLFLGAKIACLDPSLGLTDTTHLIKQIRPKMTFIGPEAVKLIEDAIRESGIETEIVIFGPSSIYLQFSEFLKPAESENCFMPVPAADIWDTAVIFFSSGTTGLPKGICVSHRAILMQIYEFKPQNEYHEGFFTSTMLFSSLYWISSATVLLIVIFFNKSRVIFPTFDVGSVWKLIERTKVNAVFFSAHQIHQLCNMGKPEKTDTSKLKQVVITGCPASKEQIFEMRRLLPGTDIINLYGISEAGGYTMSFLPHLIPDDKVLMCQKGDSCGRPRQGISCKVVDNETGEILGPHQRGELRIKTDHQMNGYFNMDSSNCWDADGWLKSGDEAYYDEDNCFFIVDRIKELLKFQIWHLAPAKLEWILQSHPAVKTAVVVGLPHPEDGDHAVGVVVLRSFAVGTISADEVQRYVDERVDDRYKLRGGVRIVERIPVTPTGTNRRRDMKELVLLGEI